MRAAIFATLTSKPETTKAEIIAFVASLPDATLSQFIEPSTPPTVKHDKLLLEFALHTTQEPPYLINKTQMGTLQTLLDKGINLNDSDIQYSPYLLKLILIAETNPAIYQPLVSQALSNGSSLLFRDADHITIMQYCQLSCSKLVDKKGTMRNWAVLPDNEGKPAAYIPLKKLNLSFEPVPPGPLLDVLSEHYNTEVSISTSAQYPTRHYQAMHTTGEMPKAYALGLKVLLGMQSQFPLATGNRVGDYLFKTRTFGVTLLEPLEPDTSRFYIQSSKRTSYGEATSYEKPITALPYYALVEAIYTKVVTRYIEKTSRQLPPLHTTIVQTTIYAYLHQLFRAGNCETRQAAALLEIANTTIDVDGTAIPAHHIHRVEALNADGMHHFFIAIDRDPRSNLHDPTTWGKDCIVLDQYKNVVCRAHELKGLYKHLFSSYKTFDVSFSYTEHIDEIFSWAKQQMHQATTALIAEHVSTITGLKSAPIEIQNHDAIHKVHTTILQLTDLAALISPDSKTAITHHRRYKTLTAALFKPPTSIERNEEEVDPPRYHSSVMILRNIIMASSRPSSVG
ncbi:MAG: hypothetical protein P1U63_04720 [Coxiellaceae bacterium]|nr:hypothetical protein [Coxiellaceae bacterium]